MRSPASWISFQFLAAAPQPHGSVAGRVTAGQHWLATERQVVGTLSQLLFAPLFAPPAPQFIQLILGVLRCCQLTQQFLSFVWRSFPLPRA
jgi:hypothetical protein